MSSAKSPMSEQGNPLARIRAFVERRRTILERNSERGALSNALILVLVVTTLLIVSMSWFFFRQTLDYTTAQQAQVRSSINQLASNVLGQMNSDFPREWQYMDAEGLTEATSQFGNTPELGANSHVTFFAVNPESGVVTAEMEGKSDNALGVTAKARVQFVPSGAGVFTGLDAQGRPVWVYSDDNLDALALWELNPNSIEYLTPGGDYTSVAPPIPPSVNITASGNTATSTFSNVYCQYGGSTEYRYRYKMGNGEWTAWSEWAAGKSFNQNINQGQKISVQAMARCRTSMGVTDPTAASEIAEYTHPILPPPGAPTLTIAPTGVASWTTVSCGTGTTPQYQHRTRLDEGTWTTWTTWADGVLSHDTKALEGARIEFQVRARCASEFAVGNQTATASAQLDRPITSAPTKPTVSIGGTNTVTTTVSTAATTAGLTAEYRYRVRVNGGNTWTYGPWTTNRIDTRAVDQGSKVEGQGQSRYVSPYVQGPGSPESDIVVLNVPVTTKPDAPLLTLASGFNQFTIGQVTCPAGTTPRYTWLAQVNDVTRETYTNISPNQFTRNVTVPEGGKVRIVATANCLGNGTQLYGPSSDESVVERVRPVTSIPSAPTVTYAANGAPTWVKAGCATGTTWESRSRYQMNAGGWSNWTGWGAANGANSPINQGERVQFDVEARCVSGTDATLVGPSAASTGDWHIYEITAQPTVGGKTVIAGAPPVASYSNPTNCPATTTARVSSRTGMNDSWAAWGAFAATLPNFTFDAVSNGDVARAQLQARCVSDYSTGPTYQYTVVSFTTPVTATTASPTVSWNTSTWATFQFTDVTCGTGLSPQYQYRTKSGVWSDRNEGGWTRAWSAWGGNPGAQTLGGNPWYHGDYFDVQVATRCINQYSSAAGPVVEHAAQARMRDMPAGPTVHIGYDGSLNSNWTVNGNACPAGTVTDYSSFNRVNWEGSMTKEPGNMDSGWTGWDRNHRSRGTQAEEGRAQKTYVQTTCYNDLTGARGAATNQSTLGGSNGFYVRGVSAGGKWSGRAGYRHFNHGINCYNGAWGADPYFWMLMNKASNWRWEGAAWDYNNQGGSWGYVEWNSRATCTGPYANSGYQWSAGAYG
jgi:hypothetical protein